MAFPDIDCVFHLESDASDYATGAVLSIEKEGIWHPVAFSSHSMMPQERNYLIADKEMLSVIQALEQWRHYVEDARHQFEIWNSMQICNGSCKGRTLTKDKCAGCNTYLDSTQSSVTNPDHPWKNPMHSLDKKIMWREQKMTIKELLSSPRIRLGQPS